MLNHISCHRPGLAAAFLLMFLFSSARGYGQEHTAVAQGAGIPGLSGSMPFGLNGPGYIELGGSHSGVSSNNPSWNEFYAHAVMSGGKNTYDLNAARQSRWGDSGWFLSAGLTRILSENWYTELSAGTSPPGGFFLPKFRVDGALNRKLLSRKQLVANVGLGYDKSKIANKALRTTVGATYYFNRPWILQGGVSFTRSDPGAVLARSQFLAITEGHEKEHYISVRAEIGREGYELIGPAVSVFDFPVHNISASWRQWVGFNWGLTFTVNRDHTPYYTRTGGTAGIFLDF
jgi:YaiO family outer membrane protein